MGQTLLLRAIPLQARGRTLREGVRAESLAPRPGQLHVGPVDMRGVGDVVVVGSLEGRGATGRPGRTGPLPAPGVETHDDRGSALRKANRDLPETLPNDTRDLGEQGALRLRS